jgi:hypothetical protein
VIAPLAGAVHCRSVRLVSLVALALGGCMLDEVSLEGARCPCTEGWICDTARDQCVRAGRDGASSDAGRIDASRDSGPLDARVDAGSLDAAMSDAASADAGPDPSSCDDTLSGAFVCDGFEGDTLMPPWTSLLLVNGEVRLDTTTVYRGRGSLRAEVTMPSSRAAVVYAHDTVLGEGDEVYGRAYYYVPSGVELVRITGMLFIEPGDPLEAVGIGHQFGPTYMAYVGPASTALPSPGGMAVPRDRWFCVQYHAVIGVMGSVEVIAEGTTVVSMTAINTLPVGGIQNVEVGLEYTVSTQMPIAIYVDEVAAGTAPLPCD